MNFNIKKGLAGLLVVFSFVVPALTFAETGTISTTTTTEKPALKTNNNFCARISKIQTRIADQVTKTETKQSANQTNRVNKIAQKESDSDAKKAQSRSDIDAKRLQNWDNMTAKAKTDIQKTAVIAYKTSISQAVTDRRTAIDSAIKAYHDGLATTMTSHTSAIDAAMITFKASVATAVTKAQTDCTTQITSKTVSATFNKSINDARKALLVAKKSAEMTSALTDLKKTRNDAIKLAGTNFKTATTKARVDLMLVFKK